MDIIALLVVLAASVGFMGFIYVIRSPTELMSLLRNPREHLLGKNTYAGTDRTGLIWDVDPELPSGFTANDGKSGNPYSTPTPIVIFNRLGEELYGCWSDETCWFHDEDLRNVANSGVYVYARDDVLGHRPMTDSEIEKQAEFEALEL